MSAGESLCANVYMHISVHIYMHISASASVVLSMFKS